MGYNRQNERMRTILYYMTVAFIMSAVLCSCFSSRSASESLNSDADHQFNKLNIEKNYKDCLSAAQTDEEKAKCEENYQAALDDENERYEMKKNAIKERDKCEEYLRFVLSKWGYPKNYAEDRAAGISGSKKDDYSFDAMEEISLLITENDDKRAILKFEEMLPKYDVPKDKAKQVMKEYYGDDKYYTKNGFFKSEYSFLMGDDVYCNREMLIEMGFIDDDNNDDGGNLDNDEVEDKTAISGNSENNTPSVINAEIDEAVNLYNAEILRMSNFSISKFELNEVKLSPVKKAELDKIISFMKKWPNSRVVVVGHTCSIGSDVINKAIGLNRARQAKAYMVEHGIDANRIEEVSKAATEPCADNDTEEGRMQNRRITFIVK